MILWMQVRHAQSTATYKDLLARGSRRHIQLRREHDPERKR